MAKRQKATKKSFEGAGWSVGGDTAVDEAPSMEVPPALHRLRLSIVKTKNGRVVTELKPLQASSEEATALLGSLKKLCGAGGALEADTLIIQGKHVDTIRSWLKANGWGVKG